MKSTLLIPLLRLLSLVVHLFNILMAQVVHPLQMHATLHDEIQLDVADLHAGNMNQYTA